MKPFLRLASIHEEYKSLAPEAFWSAGADARVSLEAVEVMLAGAVEHLREEQLGLKLGRSMCFGEGGVFDFAVRSAATVRDAIDVAGRYSPLHSDSFRIWFETWRSSAVIRIHDQTHRTPACVDFAMSAFYKLHAAEVLPNTSDVECWFPYSAPRDAQEHERTFRGVRLRFGAPFLGFVFDRTHARSPLRGAEPLVHRAVCDRADALLASLSEWHALRARVRRFIEREIRNTSTASATNVARALGMTRRTMSRRLEAEGTSFFDELDQARSDLGLTYVGDSDIPLKEIAGLLGFSHVESFHRAFKRWSGETPHAYRQRARLVTGGRHEPGATATEPPRPAS